MLSKEPILITGVERSGSTLVTRVLQICGANAGRVNKMRENAAIRDLTHSFIKKNSTMPFMPDLDNLNLPENWQDQVNLRLKNQVLPEAMRFVYKDSGLAQIWPVWHNAYPNAKWLIVRRRTGDILHSFKETAYMKRFKIADNCRLVNAETERDGWLWWVHQYEARFSEMEKHLNVKVIWPERMRDGNFEQMQEVVEWCDLKWNNTVIPIMSNLLK